MLSKWRTLMEYVFGSLICYLSNATVPYFRILNISSEQCLLIYFFVLGVVI